jgi:transcriptional regulator with XRE-family HTH domain
MKTHERMIARWRKDPAFKAEYDALEPEFALFDELLKARQAARLTQAEVAKRMGTKVPAISRMESSGGGRKHSPSIATLQKYAAAVGCRLVVKLEPAARARKPDQRASRASARTE